MKKYNILLVDDDHFVIETLGNYLKELGYLVTTAENGESAKKKLAKKDFELVITDLVMGRVDGLSVLKKAKEVNPLSMVMILTGYGELTSSIDALRMHADDYLLKPCERDQIKARVESCLERYELLKRITLSETILPVCCICKKIRDDAGREPGTGEWLEVERYLLRRTGVHLSHGYCPDCLKKVAEEIGIA